MKSAPLFVFAATVLVVAGCNSLDNPLSGINLLHTGNDGRVYNQQTGEFEWPKDQQDTTSKKTKRSAAVTAAISDPNGAPNPKNDGRYFDAQKNQWIEPPPQSNAAVPGHPKPKATPLPPPGASVPMRTPRPRPTPPPPPPAHARGIYNPSTGQIEWSETSEERMATPNPKKPWWKPW